MRNVSSKVQKKAVGDMAGGVGGISVRRTKVPGWIVRHLGEPRSWLVASVGFMLLVMLVGSWYTWPSADDYCYSNRFLDVGISGTIHYDYFNWGGRLPGWWAMGLVGTQEWLLKAPWFGVVPMACVLAVLAGTWWFVKKAYGEGLALTAVAGGLLLLMVVSWRESIFWMAGGFNYTLPIGLFLVLLAALVRPATLTWLVVLPLALVAGFNAGFNEGMAMAQVEVLGLMGLVLVWKRDWRLAAKVMVLGIGASVGLLVEYLAPGNFVRATYLPPPGDLVQVLDGLWMPFVHITTLLALVVAWTALWLMVKAPLAKWYPRKAWHVLALLYAVLVPTMMIRAYLLSGMGPDRAQTTDVMLVWLAAMVLGHMIAVKIAASISDKPKAMALLQKACVPVLLVAVLGMTGVNVDSVGQRVFRTLKIAPKVARVLAQRHDAFTHVPSGVGVTVAAINQEAIAMTPNFRVDVDPDPKNWANECLAKFYKLGSVQRPPLTY